MYAVIETGGKQYHVAQGSQFTIEKVSTEPGEKIVFDKVLSVGAGKDIKLGAPYLDNAKVTATVTEQFRDKKIRIIKIKRRKHHMKRMGHRQYLTRVKVESIEG